MHQGPQTLESIAHDEGRFLAGQSVSGTEVAIAGAKTTAAGMILMANSAQNKSGRYERGNTSSGKSSEITFTQGTPGKERKVTVPIPKGYRKLKIRTSKDMPIYYNGKTYIYIIY